jgi:uncharacterized protein (TIGR03790 family)
MAAFPRNCALRTAIFAIALVAALVGAPAAQAGGGPENVLLVVNATSWASLSVANHFIHLRNIPAMNVVYVGWRGGIDTIDGETFRREILGPAMQTAERRAIIKQIDYILYSADFPCAVKLAADAPGYTKLPAQLSPNCSINSATYLWHLMMGKVPAIMNLEINGYMRTFVNAEFKIDRHPAEPTHGFRSWYGWGPNGILLESGGQPFMLSTVLAVTSGRGTSVSQAIDYLTRSAAADGTFPKGTIYFTRTKDVRSEKRAGEVAAAMAELNKLGVTARVVTTPMPQNAADVAGLISGVADFSWPQTRSRIVPGAICDNFTSFGGVMTEGGSQTPLTEFLRYGAAGSAGTVIEPYAFAQKFASPNIFVHYARGCTLAESYYQSIFSPAQVLIVGDALCRPWADIPQVKVSGVEPGARVSGTLVLEPAASFARGGKADRFELFVDGRRSGVARAGEPLTWDSTRDYDGYHELRVVAIAAGPIETQGRATIPVTVNNHGRTATMTVTPAAKVRWGETMAVDVKAPGMKQIYVLSNGRLLGNIAGEAGQLKFEPSVLGLGPVGLQAVGIAGNGLSQRVVPPPVEFTVEPVALCRPCRGSRTSCRAWCCAWPTTAWCPCNRPPIRAGYR